MTILVVVQARATSSRLPGKVLLPLAGAPLLTRMVERLRACRTEFELVVATTPAAEDDAITELCEHVGVACFRGHPTDCLDRHYQAALDYEADAVVKIPSDCPLIDPAVVDRVLGEWDGTRYDYLSNLHPATWPDGLDVEVMSVDALTMAHAKATRPLEREHTTPFFWENPDRFRLGNVTWDRDLFRSHRWVVDYPDDYRFVSAVFDALYSPNRIFSGEDVLALLAERPELVEINARYAGVNWYRHHLNELTTVEASETRWAPEERTERAIVDVVAPASRR